MAIQSIDATASQAAALLVQPVQDVGARQVSGRGAGPNAIAALSRETTVAVRQRFLNEAASSSAFVTGIGGIINAPVGAPEAQQNLRSLTLPNPRGAAVADYLNGVG